MKRNTFILIMLLISVYAFPQLSQEGFEGAWLPTDWYTYNNGIGLSSSWQQATGVDPQPAYQGSGAAYINKENVATGIPEDWLVSKEFTVPDNPELRFFSRLTIPGDDGTLYRAYITDVPESPDVLSNYQLLQEWTELEINPSQTEYTEVTVSVPDVFIGENVRIALVMAGDNGDRWLVDNVSVLEECIAPENLAADNITFTSADLTWDGGNANSWEVEVLPVEQVPVGSGVLVNGTPEYSPTLVEETDYKFYVRSICIPGVNESDWAGPYLFSSAYHGSSCEDPVVVTPSILPYSASGNTANNASDNFTGTPGTSCGSGSSYFAGHETLYSYTPEENEVISIYISNISGNYTGAFVYEGCENIGVECYAGDVNGNGADDLSIQELSVTAGTTYFIVIGNWSPPNSVEYNISIQKDVCPKPSNISIDDLDTESVSFSWLEGGGAESWEYVVQESGTGIPTGSGTTTTEQNGSANTLEPNTEYEIYIRSECMPGTFSGWAGPMVFSTNCSIFTTPFFEGFNSDSETEQCWTVLNENGDNLTWNLNTTFFMYEGNQVASVTKNWNSTSNDDWLISPGMQLTGNQRLRFQYRVISPASPAPLEVLLSTSGIAPASFTIELMEEQTINNNTYQEKIINLDDYTGPVNIAFHTPYVEANNWTLFIDQVIIEDIPACPDPTDLTAYDITDTTALLSWEQGYEETEWEVVVQEEGGVPPTGDGTLTSNNDSFLAQNLLPATIYEYYVRAHCSDVEDSNWVGPFVFNTTSCDPANMCNYTFNVEATSGSGNFSQLYVHQNEILVGTISAVIGGDQQYYSGTVALCPDVPFVLSWSTTYWNQYTQDVTVIDPYDEIVFNWTFSSTVNTPFFEGTPSCNLEQCPKPQNLTLTNQGTNSLTIDWEEIGTADEWEIYIVEEGEEAPGDDSTGIIVNTPPPYTIDPLYSGTLYSVYVRSRCGGDNGNSTWTAEEIYSTLISNDNCDTAAVLTVSSEGYCDSPYHATLNLATASSQGNTCGDAAYANDDVWFEFTAESTSHILYINNREGSNILLNKVVYSGDCDNLQELICVVGEQLTDPTYTLINANNYADNNNDILMQGLTVGDTYKIRVFSNYPEANDTQFDICIATPASAIAIDLDTYTPEELVTNIFAGENCSQISNINYSTGTNYGAPHNGIGYFTDNGADFPFEDGVILSTGKAEMATGPNTMLQSYLFYDQTTNSEAWLGDDDLYDYMISTGVDNNIENYYDATLIEFDFVPFGTEMNFNFIFASEDYGKFQCEWADAFAFLVTDDQGVTTNYSVVPGTTDPISVVTIRDEQYNYEQLGPCNSQNEEYFDRVYDGHIGDSRYASSNSFTGSTIPLSVQAPVEPGHQYHIKLVIAEKNDGNFDSAIFLEGDSFYIGDYNLGDDLLVSTGTALCNDESTTIDTGIDEDLFTFEWAKDGTTITGETTSSYTIEEPGTYTLTATSITSACVITDDIVVEYYNDNLVMPENLEECSLTSEANFDLTENNSIILANTNQTDYTINYYATEADASVGDTANAIQTPEDYLSETSTIYVRIDNTVTSCHTIYSFQITVIPPITPVVEFSYSQNNCALSTTDIQPNKEENFVEGGTFSVDNTDLAIDANTGIVDIANSQPGTYNVTYTLQSFDCTEAGTYTTTVEIVAPSAPITEFSYTTTCVLEQNATPELMADFTQGGQFSSSNITVDAGTGEINLDNIAPGNYQITYTVAADAENCIDQGSYTATIEIVTPSAPVTEFSYPAVCVFEQSVTPVFVQNFVQGGQFSSNNLIVNAETGEVSLDNVTSGNYEITYTIAANTENCIEQGSYTATLVINDPTVPEIGFEYESSYCADNGVITPILNSGFVNGGTFSSTEGLIIDQNNGSVDISTAQAGTYTVTYEYENSVNCEQGTSQAQIIILPVSVIELSQGCEDNVYVISVSDVNGSFDINASAIAWSGPQGFTAYESAVEVDVEGIYTVEIITQEGCIVTGEVTVDNTSCLIPRGISPNNDGINDNLDLTGFGVTQISIFNRYGKEVYNYGIYTNQWYGQSNNGDELPTGTYFYSLQLTSGESKTGWVYINRE